MAIYGEDIQPEDINYQAPSQADQVMGAAQSPIPGNQNPMQGYVDLLSQYSGNSNPQLYAQNFETPANDYESQLRGDAQGYAGATGPQAFSTYYPSMENNIQKGYYSGNMIGSNPIYAPATLYPYGMVDARRKALKDAADRKVAEMDAFKNKIQSAKAPTTQHKAVQPQITEAFYSGLNDWIKKSKNDNPNQDPYKALWGNPGFQQWMQNLNDVAGMEDQAVKHVADIEDASEKGEYALTPEIQRRLSDFKTGKHGLLTASMNPEHSEEARKILSLGPVKDALKMAKLTSEHLESDVTEGGPSISSQGLYDILTTKKVTKPNDQRIKDAVDYAWKSLYGGREDLVGLSKNEFYKLVAANHGKKVETDVKTVSTKDGDGKGLGFQMSAQDLKDGETEIISSAGNGKKGIFGIQDYYPLPAGIKPFEMASTTKVMDIEGNEAGSGKMIGNRQVIPSAVGNIYKIHKAGDKNDGKAIKESQIDQFKDQGYDIKVTPVAILTVLGIGKDDKDHTITAEIDDVSNGVEQRGKDGKYVGGVDTDVLKKRAADRQKEINERSSLPSGTKADWKEAGWSDEQIDQGVKMGKIRVK